VGSGKLEVGSWKLEVGSSGFRLFGWLIDLGLSNLPGGILTGAPEELGNG
jgi:hypothetical protein